MAEAEAVPKEPKVLESKVSDALTKKVLAMVERLNMDEGEEKEMAIQMRKEMEETYGKSWQCIVGKNFGR